VEKGVKERRVKHSKRRAVKGIRKGMGYKGLARKSSTLGLESDRRMKSFLGRKLNTYIQVGGGPGYLGGTKP